ncbi:TetR/AcrR family transcriptional regulator [Paracoccus aminophilus]|uniref:Transcriptional regulator, TetR family n=1 Tax=Paracoccus aminophilus JCM 7686 TaxID=1367847 RepID=S5XVF7_PARAH|nr:TetR/AcrR family transcriptional regulator [Paracoccus aminophilus]AGT11494.1 transcriptional regulator, TetR family [Paracoccus aminophilus JCM 7686]
MAAIEAVVRREGVGGLSIDAVAKEAGISKSSVVYDFRNKAGLLAAFTRDRLDTHRRVIEDQFRDDDRPNRSLRAMLHCSQERPSAEETQVAMLISSAMRSEEECHNIMRDEVSRMFVQIREEAPDARRARLAYIALYGLKSLEFFGFHQFEAGERQELLSDITEFLDLDDPSPRPGPAPSS